MWNFPFSYGRIVFWPWCISPAVRGSGLVLREDSSQHLAPMCRDLAALNHTMQGQLTNRIGVFRHRSAALFQYANRIRGIRKLLDVSKTSEFWKGYAKRLRSLATNDTCSSVPRKEGRLVNKSRTYKFKHLHTCSSVTSKKGCVDNKSSNSQI
jgi:hypothetical protein